MLILSVCRHGPNSSTINKPWSSHASLPFCLDNSGTVWCPEDGASAWGPGKLGHPDPRGPWETRSDWLGACKYFVSAQSCTNSTVPFANNKQLMSKEQRRRHMATERVFRGKQPVWIRHEGKGGCSGLNHCSFSPLSSLQQKHAFYDQRRLNLNKIPPFVCHYFPAAISGKETLAMSRKESQ